MAYLGLVPGEDSSGEKHRRGRITRTGNALVRRLRGAGDQILPGSGDQNSLGQLPKPGDVIDGLDGGGDVGGRRTELVGRHVARLDEVEQEALRAALPALRRLAANLHEEAEDS